MIQSEVVVERRLANSKAYENSFMIYHIEIDLNFPVIHMIYTMYGLFTVRLGTSVREYSKCNIVQFI